MKLDKIVGWYQKKIGTYDKQQWEKTVEQKILDGFHNGIQLKTAKLKTDLIDVDLVRGSTFPKAKPKQSLLTVIRLAIQRYLFLPLYAQWWASQTSTIVFGIILFLYITMTINWAVYTYNANRLESSKSIPMNFTTNQNNTTSNDGDTPQEEHIVSLSELLIPMALSLFLSLIHSQIVATNIAGGSKVKHRRVSNTSVGGKQLTREPRLRRRKKLIKTRSQDLVNEVAMQQQRKFVVLKKIPPSVDVDVDINKCQPSGLPNTTTQQIYNQDICISSTTQKRSCHSITPKLDAKIMLSELETNECQNSVSLLNKKRCVNWNPITKIAIETQEKQQQTSPQSISSTTSTSESSTPNTCDNKIINVCPDNSSTINESVIKKNCDDLITEVIDSVEHDDINTVDNSKANANDTITVKRIIGEDDGFESLNGKSSSGEEMIMSPFLTTSEKGRAKSQLRFRLNATDSQNKNIEMKSMFGYRRKVLSSESDNDKIHLYPNTAGCSKSTLAIAETTTTTIATTSTTTTSISSSTTSTTSVYQQQNKKSQLHTPAVSSEETEEENEDDGEVISSPTSCLDKNTANYNECTTSATEWLGVTTNSEECSYSSELDNSDSFKNNHISDEEAYDYDYTPNVILNPHGLTDRISCTIWDHREIKKAQLSVIEISSCIIERVESMPDTKDYIYFGIVFSFLLSFVPIFSRLCEAIIDSDRPTEINYFDVPMLLWEKASFSFANLFYLAFGRTLWERTILFISFIQRLWLSLILFMIFAVAEKTFKQRFLYAKLFSHLTSSRRARKSNLPHFRLNKVRNIKTWLSVRSYLKKRGPQRSVDVIVSAAFIITLLLLAFLSVEWLKDSVHLHSHLNLEALMWSSTIGIFLLRFMTLGNKIHQKYRSVSVLITEQINLYLQIERKPKKKDELMVANSVLKLAADLLKELDTPFKISGLSANPYLFTTIKVVILSALSGILSEMLGFKLKLHKIKIK